MAIRIMHVVDQLGKGGLENGLVNLIEHLDPTVFEHVVYTLRGFGANAERLEKRRVKLVSLNKKDSDGRIQIGALVRAIREIKPDVVHSRNWAAIEAVVAAKWVGSCRVVHSEHGLEAGFDAAEPRRRVWFRRFAYEMADQVLSVSHQLRDLHARRTGFARDRFTVIHNGVDSQRYFPDLAARSRVRQELGLTEADFCIGSVGNFFPVKGHITLLQAIASLAGSARNWRLLMIGEGPERSNLEGFVSHHPEWKDRVTFLGSSPRVPELLNAFDVYVLPSVAEGISNSLLEAMATGLPVVATHTGGNPEVVIDGESGLLFPVGDCGALAAHLQSLQNRQEWRRQLAQQALRRVRAEFSLDSMVNKYARLYESLGRNAVAPVRAAAGA